MPHEYVLALGSNQPLRLGMGPTKLVDAAVIALEQAGLQVTARSPVITFPPMGPSRRNYANAAVIVRTVLPPPDVLDRIRDIERRLGRKRRAAWGPRTLDLDIILWSGGMWAEDDLIIPHPSFRQRGFVLAPLVQIAPHWRDPLSGFSMRHLRARLKKLATRCKAG